jgi:hypothetical protein
VKTISIARFISETIDQILAKFSMGGGYTKICHENVTFVHIGLI